MQTETLKIYFTSELAKNIYNHGKLLQYQTVGSSGIDLRAVSIKETPNSKIKILTSDNFQSAQQESLFTESTEFVESYTLHPGKRILILSGFAISIQKGTEIQIRSRSGMSWNHGITVTNSPGTIDSDYRGEVGAMINNISDKPFDITQGMRVAQMVVAPVTIASIQIEPEGLDETERGSGGFGSTGTK